MRGQGRPWLVILVLLVLLLAGGQLLPAAAQQPEAERPAFPWEDGRSRAQDIRIVLVTVGPGPTPHSSWGHSGIIVADERFSVAVFYNYGQINTTNFATLITAGLGAAKYSVEASESQLVLKDFRDKGRSAILRDIELPPEARLELAQKAAFDARPENKFYLYDWYADNCTTRLRDLIDEALDGQLRNATQNKTHPLSPLSEVRRHASGRPWMDLGLAFFLTDDASRAPSEWDAMFLPIVLENSLLNITVNGTDGVARPLLGPPITYSRGTQPPIAAEPVPRVVPSLAIGLAIGALFVALGYAASRWSAARVALGLGGFLAALVASFLSALLILGQIAGGSFFKLDNENFLLASPLVFLAFAPSLQLAMGRVQGRWRAWGLLAGLALLLLALKLTVPVFDQENAAHIAILLPTFLGCAAGFWLAQRPRA